METVRDFVEKIVVGLIGNLDDAPIHRLYDHLSCKFKPANNLAPLLRSSLQSQLLRATMNCFFFSIQT